MDETPFGWTPAQMCTIRESCFLTREILAHDLGIDVADLEAMEEGRQPIDAATVITLHEYDQAISSAALEILAGDPPYTVAVRRGNDHTARATRAIAARVLLDAPATVVYESEVGMV